MLQRLFGVAIIGFVFAADPVSADEGGLSFWLPGEFASLAAVPPTPGLSFASIYYHASASAGANEAFRRGGMLVAGVVGRGDIGVFGPSYAFDGDVLGGRPSLSVLGAYGTSQGSITAELTGPLGRTIPVSIDQTITGFGDLFPQASLSWNDGVNNYMTYLTGDIPVGRYNLRRLANTGLGHGAIDSGAAYTYLNPANGLEFSATTGFTYNFVNPSDHYQNGIDWHLDWGATKFVSKELPVGLAGYIYQQATGDTGPIAVLGPFKSRVAAIGPQAGYMFPVGGMQGFVNLRLYAEFAAQNRPQGWNLWLTFALTPPS